MSITDLRAMGAEDLQKELIALRKEQFSLRMKRATGTMPKPHQFSRVRKQIARIKTLLTENAGKQ